MAFNKDRAIIGQNAATAAATIIAAQLAAGYIADDVLGEFESVRLAIAEGSLAFADDGEEAPAPRSGNRRPTRSNGGGQQANDHGAGVALKFGQYNGQTIAQVYAQDPEYIEWLAESSNNDFVRGKAGEFLANAA